MIGREKVPPSGNDKTSLLVSAHDRAGALLEILAPFAKHNISLTSIETRPALPEKWAYVFFIDLEGHVEQDNVRAAIEEIRPLVKEIRVWVLIRCRVVIVFNSVVCMFVMRATFTT